MRSNCTASPAGRITAARSTTRFVTPESALSLPMSRSVTSAGLTTRTCSMRAGWAGRAGTRITRAA